MKKLLNLLCVVFALSLVLTSAVFGGISANAETETVLSVDFSNPNDEDLFRYRNLAGDLDDDGAINATDLTVHKKVLLEISEETDLCDVNGDGNIDILDLVRLKKLTVNGVPALVENNALEFDGTVSYKGAIVSQMTANTYYKISYSYKTDDTLTVRLNGVSANGIIKEHSAKSDMTDVEFVVLADSLNANTGLELIFEGSGTIDDLSIAPTTDKWVSGTDQGGVDIFPVE